MKRTYCYLCFGIIGCCSMAGCGPSEEDSAQIVYVSLLRMTEQ